MSTEQGADASAPADYSHINQSTLSGLLEDALLDPSLGKGDPLVDWAAKLDEIERLAKAATTGSRKAIAVHWAVGGEVAGYRVSGVPALADNVTTLADAQFIAACDPSTVLAMVDENRRLREALTAMVDNSHRTIIQGNSCESRCIYCGGLYITSTHTPGCPVPAAEAALRTGGEARAQPDTTV